MAAPPIPSEQAALLAAIVAEPEEDTPRLAYADWLDEHGDAVQAEFIRLSIAVEPLDVDHPDYERLSRRFSELYRPNDAVCLKNLGFTRTETVTYRRGLPYCVVIRDPDDFFAEADAIFRLLPIRALTFLGNGPSGRPLDGAELLRLVTMPQFPRVQELELWGRNQPIAIGDWDGLVPAAPNVPQLRTLAIRGFALGDQALAWLARSPWLANVEHLDLGYNPFGPRGARALLESPVLGNLKRLGLPGEFDGPQTESSPILADLRSRFGERVFLHPVFRTVEYEDDYEDE